MGIFDPILPPYDPIAWSKLPLSQRSKLVCQAWALQGYGTPLGIYIVYAVKLLLYVGVWVLFCKFTPGLGDLSNIREWWLEPIAFQKAVAWSMAFELLGLGCGSGPLTGRYNPPVGGFLYFLRPGTTKLPLFPGLPILGGLRRTVLDVLLYMTTLAGLGWLLVSPSFAFEAIALVVASLVLLGITDKTLFMAARAEHYWTMLVCMLLAGPATATWIAGAKAVQLALWFWAGVSKLNPHFSAVVCVMTSNSPVTRSEWLRKRMYRSYPDDLRPSRLAAWMGHAGTALEFGVPMILIWAPGGTPLLIGIVLMLMLHGYITSNVPMGVPIEWNFMMVYGGFALFWAHPDISVFDLGVTPLTAFLIVMLIALPLVGNLVPRAVSFLLAMRYYAGNWAYGVWLFRGESYRKLDRLTKSSAWVFDQLAPFYDHPTSVGLVGKVMGFRLMHLHGRALAELVPKAVDRLEDYEWADGELVAGLALGWNFGDGHLHDEQLLRSLQAQCAFEPGELRCIFVEAQPLGGSTQHWRIVDASSGSISEGQLEVKDLLARQPW
jgi:hypothetical protein